MIGVITVVSSVRKRAIVKYVVREGNYVMADVTDIRPNFSIQVNGQCPYILKCHYRDPMTNALHIFKSRNLFFYPAKFKNKQVRVYVEEGILI